MSRLNNMLRDLDEHRSVSDNPAVSLRLMPEPESLKSDKKKLLPYVIVGLLMLVAASVYYLGQLDESNSGQQLDNLVQPLSGNSAIISQI